MQASETAKLIKLGYLKQ